MKSAKINISFYFYLFLFISIGINMDGQVVLQDYLKTAALNNPSLTDKFNDYMAALEKVPQVGALPDPTIAFGYFIQPVETRVGPQQARISAAQMFPWFGTLSARKNSVESFAKAKYRVFEEAKSKLFFDVKSTYYNLFFMHQSIDVTLKNIEILSSFKNLANIKIESGLASSADVYRVEMEINDLENQLALMKDNAQVLSVKFNSFLNVDINTSLQIEDQLSEISLISKQIELDSIMANNHSLAVFNYQMEGLQHRQKLALKEGLPQFNVGIDYTFIGKGNSTASNAGRDAFMFPKVGITIPLYRKKYKAKVQEVIYLQKAKFNEKSSKQNALIVLFEITWKDYQDALRRITLYHKQEYLASKSLSILESEYATNHTNFEELLRMERKLLKYALELQKAKVDKEAAAAFIKYLQGR